MKAALAGHSGCGKSTLARFMHEKLGIHYQEGSAGLMMNPKFIDSLKDSFPEWKQSGHKEVINLSNRFPDFGYAFQRFLLLSRASFIRDTPEFITDRSPVDNITYALLQTSHNQSMGGIEVLISMAQKAFSELTHFIYITSTNPTTIEDNGSRVANIYYQRMVDSVFKDTFIRYFQQDKIDNGPKVLIIDYWDLDKRKKEVLKFLSK